MGPYQRMEFWPCAHGNSKLLFQIVFSATGFIDIVGIDRKSYRRPSKPSQALATPQMQPD